MRATKTEDIESVPIVGEKGQSVKIRRRNKSLFWIKPPFRFPGKYPRTKKCGLSITVFILTTL